MQRLDTKKPSHISAIRAHAGGMADVRRSPVPGDRTVIEVGDLFARIDLLAELCELGLMTETEFEANKRDLLNLN